jgi:glycosyltransferase involved in cell wall biosynthesis
VATALRVARSEGLAATRDRLLDRLADARRDRLYVSLSDAARVRFETPVLNLLATPPSPRFGGVPTQFLARVRWEEEERPVALLYPTGRRYRLELTRAGRRARVDQGAQVPDPVSLADPAFESAVVAAAARVGARLLHPEGVAALPLESLLRLRDRGFRLLLSIHDFALFCPRPHLVERPAERFCDYCRDLERCRRCLAADWRVEEGFQARRREVARELLLAAEAVVYPSSFLRERHADLFGPLDPTRQHVIEPGVDLKSAPPPSPRPVRHLAYVGAVHPHKGALVFEEVVKAMASTPGLPLRFTVLGGGDPRILARLRRLPRVHVRGYYRAGSLPSLLRREAVDLALLLSIWPESYGITLDECRAAGVPVVAFDHGAMGERIRRDGGGRLVPAGGNAAAVVDALTAPSTATLVAKAGLPDPARAARAILALYSRVLAPGEGP